MICPTSPVPLAEKFLFFRNWNQRYSIVIPPDCRGASAIVTNVGRDAVDAAAPVPISVAGRDEPRERKSGGQTNGVEAYGKTVWSWHPLLMPSQLEVFSNSTGFDETIQSADDGDKRNSSPGRARHKP